MEEQWHQRPKGVLPEHLLILFTTAVDDIAIQEDGPSTHVFPFLPASGRPPLRQAACWSPQPLHHCLPAGHHSTPPLAVWPNDLQWPVFALSSTPLQLRASRLHPSPPLTLLFT